MSTYDTNMGILCGGGPAPGLNALISAATSYAVKLNWKVIGFHYGYKYLATGDPEIVKTNSIELKEDMVADLSDQGGSIIIPDRFNPTKSPTIISNVLNMLYHFKIRYLLVVGGNDKIFSTHLITQGVDPFQMSVIAVPKTIDNDIQLPPNQSTFGYHTARAFASKLVMNLIEDARSAPRWFVIEMMGKNTGHLALSVANATGAHLAVIPEDFGDHKVTLKDICDLIEGAIYKRKSQGKNYGVCIICEGLINKMSQGSIQELYQNGFIPTDRKGDIILDDVELGRAVRNEIEKRMQQRMIPIRVTSKKIGYELRGCSPSSFDAIYCTELGYGAVEGFKTNHSNCMVVWKNGKISYKSFRTLMDPETGAIVPRKVDVKSEPYKIARLYFWQMRPEDISDSSRLKRIADAARLTPNDFIIQFGHVPSLTVA